MEAMREVIGLLSAFVIPVILVGFPLYGLYKRVPVYETFVEGAKEGFGVAVRIIPYLVAILFAIGMFRASGAMDALIGLLNPVLALVGFPAEVLRWRSSGRLPVRAPQGWSRTWWPSTGRIPSS